MKTLKKRRRIQVIVMAFVALGLSVGLMGYAFRDGINFFYSPTQVVDNPPEATEVFRIGGLVEEGSVVKDGTTVAFRVTDGVQSVPVVYDGILPDLFEENQGMVGQGRYINGIFEAFEILAKHDEEYIPKEVLDVLKENGTYVAPDAS
ncbi:cytochrome c maturation protein CcmE [Cognatiyoonia sp.]|uniref:cytochrome c maturation protein CcmE n=1 Tax=Cognatiyoonia sp. TaxID=2211652 RepID=UPI003F6A2642